MNENLKLVGTAVIKRIDTKTGDVIDIIHVNNTVVNTGKERVAKLLNGESTAEFKYIAVGTGTTAVVVTDTALETENTRSLGTTGYEASYKATIVKVFTFAGPYSITEAGLFDSLTESGSVMFDRFTFAAREVDVDTDLSVEITITVA